MKNPNYDRMELFADILEPATMILADPDVVGVFSNGEPNIRAVKYAIKNHKDEVIDILARLEGVEPKDYVFDGMRVTMKLLAFINRPEVLDTLKELFTSPRNDGGASSGDATESIEDGAN